ncbi:MAG: MBL fold metallo-hydrolase [Clostridiales bacterium]|nr:MBL fold metallo-hydrolase [Clostridiales bacterium]
MSAYELRRIAGGILQTNCYILSCTESKRAAVIDPGHKSPRITEYIEKNGLLVQAVINTHGHLDHIVGNRAVAEKCGAPIMMHAADIAMLKEVGGFAFRAAGESGTLPLEDGGLIEVGSLALRVIHTPGHTPGGICLLSGDILFSGDTLFRLSIGRADLPGGDFELLLKSIREKLLPLDDGVKIYPGHGPASTIGDERRYNPYLQD